MADFKTVARAWGRMCHKTNCEGCPVGKARGKMMCRAWMYEHPEELERLVMRWMAENPIVTNRMKFMEVFGFDFLAKFSTSECDREWLEGEYKKRCCGSAND